MLLKLALKDLFFDRLISSCQVAAIASILAPLLLLFSLRYGIVNELENKLLQDPTVLSLTLDSSAQLDSAFFDKLLEDQDVGFVIPEVSALSALVNLHFGNRVERVAVMATAPDDPIVENSNISFGSSGSVANTNNVTSSNEASNANAASKTDSQKSANSNVKKNEGQQTAPVAQAAQADQATQDKQRENVSQENQHTNQNLPQNSPLSLDSANNETTLSSSAVANGQEGTESEFSLPNSNHIKFTSVNNTNGTTDVAANGSVKNASITATDKDSENATNENSEQAQNEQNPETTANATNEPKVNSADVNAAVANTSSTNSKTVNADIGAASNAANGLVSNVSDASAAQDNVAELNASMANAAQDNEPVYKTEKAFPPVEDTLPPEVDNSKAEKRWLKGGLADNEALVTEDIARKYQIKTGDELKVVVSRTKNGQGETKNKTFKVKGIIKQRFVNDDFLAVNLNVLKAIDDYRVGLEPAIFSDGSNIRTTKRTYAKFRLFAKSIDSVIPLYNKLIKQGLNVSSKVGQIENIQAIARVLNFIFIVIALVSGIGGALALSGLMLSSLKSRKRNFVLLRLMGQSRRETYFLVLLENVMLSSLGFILAWAFYMAGSQVFNQYFGAMLPEAVISHLTVEHGLIFYLSTVLIAALLALWSAKYIFLKAHIADVLREA